MIDQLLKQLQGQLGPELMNKAGLNQQQTGATINAAIDSVKGAVGGKGVDMGTVLNLFSGAKNTGAADSMLSGISNTFMSKLTGQVGLDAGKAQMVNGLVMPMLTKMLSDKIGGNAANLSGLLGNLGGGDIGGAAKGLLGKLFR